MYTGIVQAVRPLLDVTTYRPQPIHDRPHPGTARRTEDRRQRQCRRHLPVGNRNRRHASQIRRHDRHARTHQPALLKGGPGGQHRTFGENERRSRWPPDGRPYRHHRRNRRTVDQGNRRLHQVPHAPGMGQVRVPTRFHRGQWLQSDRRRCRRQRHHHQPDPGNLRQTTFASYKAGDQLNIEVDHQTMVLVDVVERTIKGTLAREKLLP